MRVKIGYNLRTLEQLGYVAGVELLVDRNSVGIGIYVLAHIDKHRLPGTHISYEKWQRNAIFFSVCAMWTLESRISWLIFLKRI